MKRSRIESPGTLFSGFSGLPSMIYHQKVAKSRKTKRTPGRKSSNLTWLVDTWRMRSRTCKWLVATIYRPWKGHLEGEGCPRGLANHGHYPLTNWDDPPRKGSEITCLPKWFFFAGVTWVLVSFLFERVMTLQCCGCHCFGHATFVDCAVAPPVLQILSPDMTLLWLRLIWWS